MTYVFDTNAFRQLFHSFYRSRFPSLWIHFDELIEDGLITSTREVYREIEDAPVQSLRAWAKDNKELFPTPTAAEAGIVSRIFAVKHFQQIIEQKKLLKGGKNADPLLSRGRRFLKGPLSPWKANRETAQKSRTSVDGSASLASRSKPLLKRKTGNFSPLAALVADGIKEREIHVTPP